MNFTHLVVVAGFGIILMLKGTAGQNCKFDRPMGEDYNKCFSVCQGRNFKCVADDTCVCQHCKNSKDNSFTNTYDDVTCRFDEDCSRHCAEASSNYSDQVGKMGRGKRCYFVDDFFGLKSSVCVCTCRVVPQL